ncbi:hypothetical protein MMC14_004969 [Varicellaria rhodocarpa]|nr:hypothetical protein [Varicellaria rhodocarpa]
MLHPQPGVKAACVGYSGRIDEAEAAQLRQVAQGMVQQRLQYSANLDWTVLITMQVPPIDLDKLTKPGMKSCAPGTVDNARMKDNFPVFGVSATL